MPIRRAAGTPPQETAPSTAAEGEPDATSEGSPSVEEEEQAASSASPGEGEALGEAEPTENGEEAEAAGEKKVDESGKKGLALTAWTLGESEKCKDCIVGQCATHCYVLLLRLKDGYKLEKSKVKKVKRTVPAWATMSASKKVPSVSIFPGSQPKVDDILIEAIKSSADRSGMSFQSVMKYIVMKYPGLDLDKRKFLIKKALKKHVEKGAVKQLKGKGLSGSFAIGKLPTTKPQAKKAVTSGVKAESLGDALPLIITRLCEPKEASYILIKKYLEQHFPHLNVESRPDVLKSALIKAVDRGLLERITGKGASGTFQLKRSADKAAKGGPLDDAIVAAVTAMNEPKTCSTQTLRKYLVDNNKDTKEGRLVATLTKTLTKCKMLGWMDQITGKGFQGTYRLSFPFYPSPAVLYPDKVIAPPPKKKEKTSKSKFRDDSSDEEDEDEEEEDEDDEPPPKRKAQKRPAPKARVPPRKKPRTASPSKAKGKRPPPKKRGAAPAKKAATPAKKAATPAKKAATPAKKAVTPAKKVATPAKKVATPAKKAATPAKKATTPAKKAATPAKKAVTLAKKPAASLKASPSASKATPVKKAAPVKKPKTPVVKKMTNRGSKPSGSQKSSLKEPAAKKEAKTKPSARRSQRKL